MADPTTIHDTFVIERSYSKAPARVFAAFSDPEQKKRWFGEGPAHDLMAFEQDFRVGGTERLVYRFKEGTPIAGALLSNELTYQNLTPNKRIVFTQNMAVGDHRISTTLVTIEFLPSETGTDLICTHQGAFYEGADGPEMRHEGWKTLFDRLEAALA